MADTKKEHYVPRCYLKYFTCNGDKIKVYDKFKTQIREQRTWDVAMENYFYDLDFEEVLGKVESTELEKIKLELMKLLNIDSWDDIITILRNKKHIETEFFSNAEGVYSDLLETIINKSYNGNIWVIENCFALSEKEKSLFSLFIAIQMIRTRAFRDSIGEGFEKMTQALMRKLSHKENENLPNEAFEVKADKEFVKWQHGSMIMDKEMIEEIASVFSNHIWVIYVNKTSIPFYTSDNPVVPIPHKRDRFLSYSGIQSEAIEIVFPLSPNLLLAMYDAKTYSSYINDRSFIAATHEQMIEQYNQVQVTHSHRCIFSSEENFELADNMCKDNPRLQEAPARFDVG